MKLSIHNTINKPDKADISAFCALGNGWLNVDVEWAEAFELITVDGFATSAWLSSHVRNEDNFISRELIMIDIDSGMSIGDLFNDTFYNNYGAGFYATPSYTHINPKLRIMFRVEEPITDVNVYRKIVRSLFVIYPQSDKACADGTRLFFGTKNCVIKEKTEKFLPKDIIEMLIALDDARQAELPVYEKIDYAPISDTRKAKIITLLSSTPIIDYNQWRTIAWGLKQGGFDLADFVQVTRSSKKDRSTSEATTIWNDGKSDGKVTMGSIIHIIKEAHGADCLRETTEIEYTKIKLTGAY